MNLIQLGWTKIISNKSIDFKPINKCRLCNGELEDTSLNLGLTGLANELYTNQKAALEADKFPLVLKFCKECFHIQLNDIVSPERMFANYVYQSGFSSSFHTHFEELASQLKKLVDKNDFVLEIGSNDGLLLSKLQEIGVSAVGVEPSKMLADKSNSIGLKTVNGFWSQEIKDQIILKFGKPKLVVANNVFAHIEDMRQTTNLISEILDNDGYFVFEVSYFGDVFEKNLFDTIYHEHMSYHTVLPLIEFFKEFRMKVIDVVRVPIHGGSIRVIVAKDFSITKSTSVKSILDYEVSSGLNKYSILDKLQNKIDSKKREVHEYVNSISNNDFVFGYTAPAKLVTFLSVMGIESLSIQGIIDDNPSKQNKFLPVSGIRITSIEDISLLSGQFDYSNKTCLVFAWNIGSELVAKLKEKLPGKLKIVQFMPSLNSVDL